MTPSPTVPPHILQGPEVSITVPAGPVSVGSTTPGGTLTAQLGTMRVDDTRLLLASWVATVSAGTCTTTGGAISNANVAYWSGGVTASTGLANRTPGPPTSASRVALSVARTAFSAQALVLGTSTSWNPTLVVAVPATAIAGTYTCTVTHTVV